MRPLSSYRDPAAAAELAALAVPVLVVGMQGAARAIAAEYRTATRDATTQMPSVEEAFADEGACLAPLAKSTRNPYQNFIFVGRASTCDLVLRDASVSKSHAWFERQPTAGPAAPWMIRDNRSHNGTWINGQRLEPYARRIVANGDAMVFGTYPAYLVMPDNLRRILGTMGPLHA